VDLGVLGLGLLVFLGRLLNYAFLIKLGFQVKKGRLINPSSVFYTNRDQYYAMLSKADSLQNEDILEWCEYFLRGLKNEVTTHLPSKNGTKIATT